MLPGVRRSSRQGDLMLRFIQGFAPFGSALLVRRAARAIATTIVASAIAVAAGAALAAPPRGGAANIAMIGEPQTLDPMASTADLVGTIMLHVYELLYTFDANWTVTPMLAESMPAISSGGLVYTIALRKDVKFHNGRDMNSDDV